MKFEAKFQFLSMECGCCEESDSVSDNLVDVLSQSDCVAAVAV